MRLELMKDHPTAIGVLNKVAEMSDWETQDQLPEGQGLGLAHAVSSGTLFAMVVKVELEDDEVIIMYLYSKLLHYKTAMRKREDAD